MSVNFPPLSPLSPGLSHRFLDAELDFELDNPDERVCSAASTALPPKQEIGLPPFPELPLFNPNQNPPGDPLKFLGLAPVVASSQEQNISVSDPLEPPAAQTLPPRSRKRIFRPSPEGAPLPKATCLPPKESLKEGKKEFYAILLDLFETKLNFKTPPRSITAEEEKAYRTPLQSLIKTYRLSSLMDSEDALWRVSSFQQSCQSVQKEHLHYQSQNANIRRVFIRNTQAIKKMLTDWIKEIDRSRQA